MAAGSLSATTISCRACAARVICGSDPKSRIAAAALVQFFARFFVQAFAQFFVQLFANVQNPLVARIERFAHAAPIEAAMLVELVGLSAAAALAALILAAPIDAAALAALILAAPIDAAALAALIEVGALLQIATRLKIAALLKIVGQLKIVARRHACVAVRWVRFQIIRCY